MLVVDGAEVQDGHAPAARRIRLLWPRARAAAGLELSIRHARIPEQGATRGRGGDGGALLAGAPRL